jgi:hypothetical protein
VDSLDEHNVAMGIAPAKAEPASPYVALRSPAAAPADRSYVANPITRLMQAR